MAMVQWILGMYSQQKESRLQCYENNFNMNSLSLRMLALCLTLYLTHCTNGTQQSSISVNRCHFIIGAPLDNFTFLYCQSPNKPYQPLWESCINDCCHGMVGSSYPIAEYEVLRVCQQHPPPLEDKDSDLMVVGVSVAGSLIFFGLFIITCKLLSLLCDNRVVQDDSNQNGELTQGFTIGDGTGIQWMKCQQQGNCSADVVCSICLEGDPFVQLRCRHFFHSQCIGLWLKKSHFCPNCNNKDTFKMKYYCQKCQQGYFILRKKALLDNLENLRKLTCKNCENLEDIDDVARLSTSWRCQYGQNRLEKSTDNVLPI